MTWRELKNLINKRARNYKEFLDTKVSLYDYKDGQEYDVDITELLCGEEEAGNGNDTNWVTYLSINHEESNETETKETSVD